MDDASQGINGLAVEQQVQAHEVGSPLLAQLIIEAGVAGGQRLEVVVERASQLRQRQAVPASKS